MKNTRDNINQQIQYLLRECESNILELVIDSETSRYFVYNQFEPSFQGTSTSVDYATGIMLELTEFLEIPRQQVLNTAYKQAFDKFVESHHFLHIRFQKDFLWLAYGK